MKNLKTTATLNAQELSITEALVTQTLLDNRRVILHNVEKDSDTVHVVSQACDNSNLKLVAIECLKMANVLEISDLVRKVKDHNNTVIMFVGGNIASTQIKDYAEVFSKEVQVGKIVNVDF